MRRWLRLFLLRWREEALLASCDHHRASRDLHASAYARASDELRDVRIAIAVETPTRTVVAQIAARSRRSS